MWGRLSYQEGELSVTVPQGLLETAAYPVRVDPTFGYATAGGTSVNIANASGDVSIRWGSAASSTEASSTLISIHASLNSSSGNQSVDVTAFLNAESVGDDQLPEITRAERTGLSFTTTQEWFTFTPASSPNLTAGNYVLSIAGDGNDASARIQLWYDDIGTRNDYVQNSGGVSSYTTVRASPWAIGEQVATEKFSLYATYAAICQ